MKLNSIRHDCTPLYHYTLDIPVYRSYLRAKNGYSQHRSNPI